MNLQNVRVASKLWFTICGLLAIMLLTNLWSRHQNNLLQTQSHEALQEIERKIAATQHLRGTALAASEIGIAQFATNEPRVQAELRKRLTANARMTVEAFDAMAKSPMTDGERAQFDKLNQLRGDLRKLRMDKESALDENDYMARADFAFGPYVQGADVYYQAFDNLIDHQRQMQQEVMAQAEANRQRSALIGWATNLVLLVLGVVLARWLVVSIQSPLNQAVAATKSLGEGKLNITLNTSRQDEFGQLLSALNDTASQLRKVVTEVRSGVGEVAAAATEVANGSSDLSARTEQTAANLEETAASIEEMSSSLSQASDSMRQTNQLAMSAVQAAERGGNVVQQVVHSMEQINTSSRKISDIIGVIDGIAFQTNILALNAAVEAARAGEQGRGFAVVAGEVRSLAQRSAEAAKEIKTLISASVNSVNAGSEQVHLAGETMQEIVSSVRRVTDLVGEITAVASEQNIGFTQVNQAVANLDQMTQQNATLVEETSAAAASMREQSQRLAQVVSVFEVGGSAPAVAYSPAPARTSAARQSQPAAASATGQRAAPALAPARAALGAASTTAAQRPSRAPAAASHANAGAHDNDDWESF